MSKRRFEGQEHFVVCLGSDAFMGWFIKNALADKWDFGSVHGYRDRHPGKDGTLTPDEYADIFVEIMKEGYNVIGWCKNFSDSVVAETLAVLRDRGMTSRAYDFSCITKVNIM